MHTTMMTSMSMEGLGRLVRKKVRSPLVYTRRLREPDGPPRMSTKSPGIGYRGFSFSAD
jgi:hypothetical protein